MSERLKEALDAIIEAHGFGLDVPHTLSEAIERAKAIVAGEVEAAEAEAAWWKKKHGEDAGGLMDKWRTERARAEAAEASAAAMREALWSVGAELVHRKPSHIDHAPDEDCEACVFEAMLQHIDRALSSDAGEALLERLRTAEERAEKAERTIREYEEDDADIERRENEEEKRFRRAVKEQSDGIMKAALGPDWSNMWGPTLEELGRVVDRVVADSKQAEARIAELEKERDGLAVLADRLREDYDASIARLEEALREIAEVKANSDRAESKGSPPYTLAFFFACLKRFDAALASDRKEG